MTDSISRMTSPLSIPEDILRRQAGRARGFGIALMVLGALAIILPTIFTIGFEILVSVLLILAGVLQLVAAAGFHRSAGWFLPVITGLLTFVVGILFLFNPFSGAAALTVLLAALFFVNGVFRIIYSIKHREVGGTGWGILNGTLGILIALLVWSAWPSSATWFIGLLLGIDLLFLGLSLTFLGSAWRRQLPAPGQSGDVLET